MKIKCNNKWFHELNISEGIILYRVMNVILIQYDILCDTYLGIYICAIIIIPCACIKCSNVIDLTWDTYLVKKYQTRYYSLTK